MDRTRSTGANSRSETGSPRSSTKPDPNDAREVAAKTLERVERDAAWASLLLDRSSAAFRDARDAALARELVLGVLRFRAVLDHVIARAAARPTDRIDATVLTPLRIAAYELLFLDRVPEFASVSSAVSLVLRLSTPAAGRFANAVLRRIAREGRTLLPPRAQPGNIEALALETSHPSWWVSRLVARHGWEPAKGILVSQNRVAPTVIRVRDHEVIATIAGRLAEAGVLTEPGRFAPRALRITAGRVGDAAVLAAGTAWVQDEASQLVPELFGPEPGVRVADLCAAPGTKAFALADRLAEGGRIVAIDRHPGRLARLRREARRLGLPYLYAVRADATRCLPLAPGFDRVLVDAPCTGTGTMRRHPEIRWRLGPEDPARLARVQVALLEQAAEIVAPDGRLVYSVCSMDAEEGEGAVRDFLEKHQEFAVAPIAGLVPESLIGQDGFMRTTPVDGLDGFFAAALVRRPGWR